LNTTKRASFLRAINYSLSHLLRLIREHRCYLDVGYKYVDKNNNDENYNIIVSLQYAWLIIVSLTFVFKCNSLRIFRYLKFIRVSV